MNVDLVIAYLKDHGRYSPSSEPIHILDIDFQFDGVLRGPDSHNGLVLVHAISGKSLTAISNKIRAFTLALERADSMRIVTLVLVGKSPDSSTLVELNRLCRVLAVSDDPPLGESLASILPLALPTPLSASGTADAALKKELDTDFSDPLVSKLLKAARESEDQVQNTMRSIVDELAQLPKSK